MIRKRQMMRAQRRQLISLRRKSQSLRNLRKRVRIRFRIRRRLRNLKLLKVQRALMNPKHHRQLNNLKLMKKKLKNRRVGKR